MLDYRICTRDSSNNPYPSDVIFSTSQHEGLHALGIGHSNIAGDPLCSSEQVVNVNVKTCDDKTAPNFDTQQLSDYNIASLIWKYGKNGPAGPSQTIPLYSRFEITDIPNLDAAPDFTQKLAQNFPASTPSVGITPNVAWTCTKDNTCDPVQISNYLRGSGSCVASDPSCNPQAISDHSTILE